MSKNIKLNDTDYTGISTVQLPTTDGGTASFKDTDEITTPSGSLSITENGTFDVTKFASAIVNVVSSGGSGDMESGSFIGDGSSVVTIPVTSKKSNVFIYADIATVVEANTAYANICIFAKSGYGMMAGMVNYAGNACTGGLISETNYTSDGSHVEFSENSISVKNKTSGTTSTFASNITYNWFVF